MISSKKNTLIKRIVQTPFFEWIAGLTLIVISFDDLTETLVDGLSNSSISSEHSMFVYGVLLFLRQSILVFPSLYLGVVHLFSGVENAVSVGVKRILKPISENPWLELVGGLLLALTSGLYAEGAVLTEEAELHEFSTHHVLVLYGLFNVIKFLVYTLEGIDVTINVQSKIHVITYPFKRHIRAMVSNRWFHIGMGFFLVTVPFVDAWETIASSDLSYHHGSIVIGLVTIAKGLPDLYDSMDYFERAQMDTTGNTDDLEK
ncbi:MAG: hypothetical protein HQL69_18315 [Magnetococcales bacterium]|nr:hypothetical protein [Magnetococcales bacterium]